MKGLQLVLRNQPIDKGTPKQKLQRARFSTAAKEAAAELRGSKLKGAARVMLFNQLVGQRLRELG